MASSAVASAQPEPSFEERLALSRLLLKVFGGIDIAAIHAARWRDYQAWLMSLEEGQIPSDTEVNLRADVFSYPEELTMHIVLGDALQYLQIREIGFLASREVRGYSDEELIASLQRLLELSQPWPARFPSVLGPSPNADNLDYVLFQHTLKLVIAQLEKGIWPIEPLAIDNPSGYAWAAYLDAALAQGHTRRGLSSRGEDMTPGESSYTTVSLQTPSQAAGRYTSGYLEHGQTGSSTPLYVRRSPSAISAVFATTYSQTSSSAESHCSVTPSESPSQVRDDQSNTVRYFRRPEFVSAMFNQPQRESAPSPEQVPQQPVRNIEGNGMAQTAEAEQQEQETMDGKLSRIEALIDAWLQEEQGE